MRRGGGSSCRPAYVLVLALLTWHSSQVCGTTLTAEGVGQTPESALRSALRNAVEQGVGTYVTSQTLVKNMALVSDRILSRTEGYVSTYSVLSETREFGLVRVRVSAEVAKGKLRDDLAACKLLYEMQNKPRIMVQLDEYAAGTPAVEKSATHTFEQALVQKGFKVVEADQFEKIRLSEQTRALSDADLASLAFRDGADLLVKGTVSVAEATPITLYGTQFYTVPVQFDVRIVQADDARVIAGRAKTVKRNSREAFSAAQFSLKVGGTALAEELVGDLMAFWQSEAYSENTVELAVLGLADTSLRRVEGLVAGIPEVSALRLRYLEGTSALYDCEIRGTVQDLREALGKQAGLAITTLTAHRITVRSGAPTQAVSYTYQPPALEIAALRLEPVFPCLLSRYAANPSAHVSLACAAAPARDVTVSVAVPQLMALPAQVRQDRLEPGQTTDLALTLAFEPGKAMTATDTRTLYAQASVTWTGPDGRQVERTLTAPVSVHGRNAIDWRQPLSLGGFITNRDPVVVALARDAQRYAGQSGGLDEDLLSAMAVFEALRALGIRYVKDPSASPGAAVLDQVAFPRQTLESRAGDCDDLAVLYAALLEAVGVTCSAVVYPDHVLVMVNTGVHAKNRWQVSADERRTVVHAGMVWVPVETTQLGKGFLDAWAMAAGEYYEAVADGQRIAIVPTADAWAYAAPVALAESPTRTECPDVASAVAQERARLGQETREALQRTIGELAPRVGSDPALANQLGLLHARAGNYAAAARVFEAAAAKNASVAARSNYACALLLSGDDARALDELGRVYQRDTSGRAAVNRALCLYVRAQTDKDMQAFVEALRQAVSRMDADRLAAALGLDLTGGGETRAAGEHVAPAPRTIDRRRLKELIRLRVLQSAAKAPKGAQPVGQTVAPFGGIRGTDPTQVARVADLLCWFETL